MKYFLEGMFKQLWHALMVGAGVIFAVDAIDRYRASRDEETDF